MRTRETIARPPGRSWMSRRIPANPKRILVGLISPIGDTLLATPALAASASSLSRGRDRRAGRAEQRRHLERES